MERYTLCMGLLICPEFSRKALFMSSNFKLKRISDGVEFPLGEISLIVGRSDSCDIQITQGHPSREHARVAERGGAVLVQDLHSTNGTFVNNKRIEAATSLQPGDVVKFGDEAFSVQSLSEPEATVLMRSLGSGANISATVIDDDDDEDEDVDATSMLEVYALPPGWDDGGTFDDHVGKLDDNKKAAINRYIEKFNRSLKGKVGIFLIFFSDGNPPVFKTLIVKGSKDGKETWSLGRIKSCDVSFENPCISKHHANITFSAGEWNIEDNKSTNGFVCKGRKQGSIALEDNLTFEIGAVDVLVRYLT